jgi:transmembrane sensor
LSFSNDGGEARSERLADGSELWLAPATTLAVAFDGEQRHIDLTRGSARFKVAHERRPFIVSAGGGSVIARGTLFEVSLATGRVTVRLFEGAVDVAMPRAASRMNQEPRRLKPGGTVTYAAPTATTSRLETPAGIAGQTETLPVMGQVLQPREYQAVALADLVAEANRIAARPIRLDPALAQRRVSGRFGIADTRQLADRLARLFDLRLDLSDPTAIALHTR